MNHKELAFFDNQLYFTKLSLKTLSEDSNGTVSTNVSRWLKSGKLVNLKNGYYTTRKFFDGYKDTHGYHEVIANILCHPSYVSLEYVLSTYNVLTEGIFPITSITLKTSRRYINETGTYTYKSIKEGLFRGYQCEHFPICEGWSVEYLIAEKSKALFDYLYFKSPTLANDFEKRDLVEELRLNLHGFSGLEYRELVRYAKIAGDKKIIKIIDNIIKYAPHHS